MLIAQISDTHIAPPTELTCGAAPMAENLRRCVESLNALAPRPDLVLLTGDVTNSFSQAEATLAADILTQLAMPLFVVPGNHDARHVLAEVFGPQICPTTSGGFVDYVVEGFPLRLIGLDTLDIGKPGGRIDGKRLDWLRARLSEGGDMPTLLFAHHPPLNLGLPETDEDGFCGAEQLAEIVRDHPNIERYLCGHVHLHTNTRWAGTIVTTAPSIGMQLTLDLTQNSTSQFYLSDPAYLLHHWTAERYLVTHHVSLSVQEGPFDFT